MSSKSHSIIFLNVLSTPRSAPLSLHDALPISAGGVPDDHAVGARGGQRQRRVPQGLPLVDRGAGRGHVDRKSTRLNSSHVRNSYAVFCLKKKLCDTVQRARGKKRFNPNGLNMT